MREIKFRQWNSIKKCYQYDIGITGPGSWGGPSYCTWDKYPLEQYTGLKDKNGREIYEGDIVKIPHAGNVVVEFGNGVFMQKTIHPCEPLSYFINKHSSNWMPEIVGNVHENIDLLEQGE